VSGEEGGGRRPEEERGGIEEDGGGHGFAELAVSAGRQGAAWKLGRALDAYEGEGCGTAELGGDGGAEELAVLRVLVVEG
jgi:hypothetical protein